MVGVPANAGQGTNDKALAIAKAENIKVVFMGISFLLAVRLGFVEPKRRGLTSPWAAECVAGTSARSGALSGIVPLFSPSVKSNLQPLIGRARDADGNCAFPVPTLNASFGHINERMR